MKTCRALGSRISALICFLLLISCFSSFSHASIPQTLAYHGLLKDSSGNLLTGTYSMTFRIYNASTGGTSLWNETQSSISVTAGKMNVLLGNATAINLTFSGDYWLSVQVGTNPEMSPRIRLTSGAYGYIAEDLTGGKYTVSQHSSDSHRNIEGVKAVHSTIAKTNFKLDAHTLAEANNMGDLVVDTFMSAGGISAGSSSNYTWRGSADYDVVVTPTQNGIDSNAVLVLHTNGADASTTFTDSAGSPKTMTASGNAQIDTAQSKFGGASGLFDGSFDYLSTPDHADFDFGTGDFTLDLWVRFSAFLGGNHSFFVHNSGTHEFVATYNSNNTTLNLFLAGTNYFRTWNPVLNTWYHLAFVRSGTTVYFFVDGTQLGSTDTSSADCSAAAEVRIGSGYNSSEFFAGWIDELRVSKGVARWTSNFTPPSSEYATATLGTATVVSIAWNEASAPTEAMVTAEETTGTGSITYYVSRDNGTTWTATPKDTVVNISSQPSGTQLKWKAVITGNAELNAVAVAS